MIFCMFVRQVFQVCFEFICFAIEIKAFEEEVGKRQKGKDLKYGKNLVCDVVLGGL